MNSLFPMFVKLDGREVLVVGAGRVGEPKIRGLLPTGAKIRVVARAASESVRQWAQNGEIILEKHGFVPADLDNVFLVVVATSSRDLNEQIYSLGRCDPTEASPGRLNSDAAVGERILSDSGEVDQAQADGNADCGGTGAEVQQATDF
jgi:hypothetical protein